MWTDYQESQAGQRIRLAILQYRLIIIKEWEALGIKRREALRTKRGEGTRIKEWIAEPIEHEDIVSVGLDPAGVLQKLRIPQDSNIEPHLPNEPNQRPSNVHPR